MMVCAVFAIILSMGVVFLALRLREKNRQLEACREKMREETEAAKEAAMAREKEREFIWDRVNAIHLYAALSEEARSRSLREKQEAILRISEQLLEQSQEWK